MSINWQINLFSNIFPPTQLLDPILFCQPVKVWGGTAMPKNFVQAVPLVGCVIPLTFVVDDQPRQRLSTCRCSHGCSQLVPGDLSIAIAINEGAQTLPAGCAIGLIRQWAVTLQLLVRQALE